MGDILQQRIATVLLTAMTACALSGCGAQQPSAVTTGGQQHAVRQSPVDPSVSATALAAAETPSPPTVTATTGTLPKAAQRVPITGRPSAQFCEAGEEYLAKFPDLPRVQPPAESTARTVSETCVYLSTIGDLAAPTATLAAGSLTGAEEELAMMQALCEAQNAVPGATGIAEKWVRSRGWSGWTATGHGVQQAMLCTGEHVLSASLLNVPGSTADDALATIVAAIE